MSFAESLQQLQGQYGTRPTADFFLDPKDPKNVVTATFQQVVRKVQPPDSPKPPQYTEQTMTLRREKSEWERVKNVSLFAGSSFSDDGAAPAVGPSHDARQPRRSDVYDEMDEESPEEAAARREAFEKRNRRIAKEAAKRVVFKNLEGTSPRSPSPSASAPGVSASSGSGGGPTPDKALGKLRSNNLRIHGAQDGLDANDVVVAGPGSDGPEASVDPLLPYVPTLRGPVSALKAMYAASLTDSPGQPAPVFSWRPAYVSAATAAATTAQAIAGLSSYSPAQEHLPLQGPVAPFAGESFGSVLSVTVRGMSPLHADASVVHPFVRVWLVHSVTGQNLIDCGSAVPCAITHPYDLRSHGSRSPWWEAEVALRLDADLVRRHHRSAVLLFEVLDCGNESIYGFFLPRSGLYPICWGFLMLHDCYGRPEALFSENTHVQMYRYPMRTAWYTQWLQSMLPPSWASSAIYAPSEFYLDESGLSRVVVESNTPGQDDLLLPDGQAFGCERPAIFSIFKGPLYRSLTYDGGLVVTTKMPPGLFYSPRPTSMLPYEEYMLNLLVAGGSSCAVPRRDSGDAGSECSDEAGCATGLGRDGASPADATAAERAAPPRSVWRSFGIVNQQALTEEYARQPAERVLLPTTTIQTAPVPGAVTSMTFFHHSPILALGVTRNLQYLVELRNSALPNLPTLAVMLGHTAHIHSVAVQGDDGFVLACSADKTVRVWRVTDQTGAILEAVYQGYAAPNVPQLVVEPVCVLPHAYPLYGAIFHQNTVITAGYSPHLQVWSYGASGSAGYGQRLSGASARASSPSQFSLTRDGSLTRLTATPTTGFAAAAEAELDTTQRWDPAHGELLCTTDTDMDGLVLSIASSERSSRVWSVSSGGTVYCWRALHEARRDGGDDLVFQISVRHKSDCSGASRVEVRGAHAIVSCRKSPVVYIFDATTCESVRVVNTRMAAGSPLRLLPDGEAFVAATKDGALVAWDCDGALCTPPQGTYTLVKTKFPIADTAWASGQQLAALQSPAPCPESFLVSSGVTAATLLPGFNAGPGVGQYTSAPMEVTLISIAGTPRSSVKPIDTSDRHASDDFCAYCGGEVLQRRRAAQRAARTRALRRQQTEHESRKTRLYGRGDDRSAPPGMTASILPDISAAFGFSTPGRGRRVSVGTGDTFLGASFTGSAGQPVPSDLEYTDKGFRFNAIVNFWRGLVRQHRHLDDGAAAPGGNGDPEAAGNTMPRSLAARTNQYVHNDDADNGRSRNDEDSL